MILALLGILITIVAGIPGGMQIWHLWKKRIRVKKRQFAIQKSKDGLKDSIQPIKILNFTHPLTPKIKSHIEVLVNCQVSELIEIMPKFDEDESFDPQIDRLVAKINFSSNEWQTGRFLVHLPGLAQGAATLLAELHGRMGHFPTVLRLRAVEGTTPREFELAEIVNLQNVRDSARCKR